MKITRRRMFIAIAALATAGLGGLGIRSAAVRYYDGLVSQRNLLHTPSSNASRHKAMS